MNTKFLFAAVALTSCLAAAACSIGDWGKSGLVVISDACTIGLYTFTCGGALGNEVIITGQVAERQTGACMLV